MPHRSPTVPAPATAALTPAPEAAPTPPDPDLHRPVPRRLLDIDWTKVSVMNDADAIALWRRIAPTGTDWEDKLEEIPAALTPPLAVAVLHGGNFVCTTQPTGDCAKPRYEVDPPAATAGFDDPCLRRLLALWSLAQLDGDGFPAIKDALLGIAAIPPPESQLVASAIHAVPEAEQDTRLAILAIAWRAGQHDLVDSAIGMLDETHLIAAARQHHITSALDVLSAEGHRGVYLAAITDEALATRARTTAIGDLAVLDDKLPPDLAAALIAGVRSKDCTVAATAARVLDQHGDHRFVPRRPRTTNTGQLMRAMCVLASYEALQHTDEASLLASYLPARGLERVTITYDALSDTDDDGDGDPHTTHTAELVAPGEAVLPELEDLIRAMQHCTGTICVSDDHEFRFSFTRARAIDSGPPPSKDRNPPAARVPASGRPFGDELLLSRIELADRPPCEDGKASQP
ncbi:MAG TPA: hypothetical protein VHN14_00250 [Kofleriaceae bacterium]|nr:hypothetical protein [Kofleriaceae bacterium]